MKKEKQKKESGIRALFGRLSIRTKLIMMFALTATLMFLINIVLYTEINNSMRQLDEVYATNVSLNELTECLEKTQEEVVEYLNTKSSDSLENYYRYVQQYRDMLTQLNCSIVDNEMKILEKNIRNMSETYLELTDETIQAKRGRNTERYKASYEEEFQNYQYIRTAIDRLNNLQFQNNSDNYMIMLDALRYMEIISSAVVVIVAVINLLVLVLLIQTITEPLRMLARSANEVAAGNFDIDLEDTGSRDEVGVVTHAFTKMVHSIREYIEKTKESMEKEQKMKERELLMETHLKDAQLKYLQAQINHHFLFNSLNAGAQLAMMEDAEKTSIFIEKMADFFRYNVRKTEETSTLGEEIEAVDNYVYILNVRFAGDIHFEKKIMPGFEDVRLPSMILQPLVENAVNHGIRNVEWEGHICLEVGCEYAAEPFVQGHEAADVMDAETRQGIPDRGAHARNMVLVIRVTDNGQGMTQERIREILERRVRRPDGQGDSTGIGMDNVINRLELFFGQKNLLEIYSDGPDQGTEVKITIPCDGNLEL